MDPIPSLAAESIPGFSEIAPLDVTCLYRFQSRRSPEPGSLRGAIVDAPMVLSSGRINEQLRQHPRWDGRSLVSLRAVFVRQRTGVFADNADALYYGRNFTAVKGTAIDGDLLDLTKLQALHAERLPTVASIFTQDAFNWLVSILGPVEQAAVNEYMCHEAGHRLTYAVGDKQADGFFRPAGRLAWPLIYMEEYRADANSWDIAARALGTSDAAQVVAYTMVHRFGLAAQNLRDGRPGAGYVPFLHFASMVDCGLLRLVEWGGRTSLDFALHDSAFLLDAATKAAGVVDREVNRHETPQRPDEGAEAMLRYAVARLTRRELAESFARVMRQ